MACNECKKCEQMCYFGIGISNSIQALERLEKGEDKEVVKAEMLDAIKKEGRKTAENCAKCGRCELSCSRKIKIVESLEKVVDEFGLVNDKKIFFY